MNAPEFPVDEAARLLALQRTNLLDTPAEKRFDRITRLAASVFKVPICLISLVDSDRQWFKSALLTKSEPRGLSPSGLCRSVDLLPDWHSKPRHFVHRLHPCKHFTNLRIVISQAQFCADELFETIHRCLGF